MLYAILGVGDFIKTYHPLSNFHLLQLKALFGCHLQNSVILTNSWQFHLERFCEKASCGVLLLEEFPRPSAFFFFKICFIWKKDLQREA